MIDPISILGYSEGSPYAGNPYLDIQTPEGLIDMSKTPIDLIGIDNKGNRKKMKAGTKNPYKFEGDVVREIPLYQQGGLSPQALYSFLFDDDEEEKKPEVTAPSDEEIEKEQPQPETDPDYEAALNIATEDWSVPTSGNPYATGEYGASMTPGTPPKGNPYNAGERGQEIISDLTGALGYTPKFNSVFRTPEKQAQLIKQGWGVKNSFHLTGDAVDLKPADWNNLNKDQQANFRRKYDVIYHNNHYHVEPKGSPKGDKAKYAYEFFQKKGLPAHHAAGIVGNLIQESGNFRDDVIEGTMKGDSGLATGIAQWHGPRREALENWAAQRGLNPYTLESQLEFVYHEAKSRGDLDALQTTTTPEQASYIFAKRYERPRIIDPNRINYAKYIYNGSSR